MKLIDAKDVLKPPRKTAWSDLFSKIPRGKAMVLEPGEGKPSTVRSQLKNFHERGEFLNLTMVTRKSDKGGYIIYLVNEEADEPASQTREKHQKTPVLRTPV